MQGHYDAWLAGPAPPGGHLQRLPHPGRLRRQVLVKATNGYHHSMAFTLGGYPDVIRARPESSAVVEANCRHCHADLVDSMPGGGDVSCIRCHASVGHLR